MLVQQLVILILLLLYNQTTAMYSCAECSAIEENVGFDCHPDDRKFVSVRNSQNESAYPNCVPNRYEITSPIQHYCCFWSPELGCSILLGKRQLTYKVACTQCEDCPGRWSGAKNTILGHKFLTGLWPIVIVLIDLQN
ncbi:uncharacterized protein LOC108043486 [Drosophila rhopaloa]|uniref:Secreted protein n=1 Tax=Drosophila rhopaloa TaxID=1041015 RepID=A0ABM5HBM6_DRORH|nr:uncharacterized protein LOC108043486 [Drosophila rhopaloa]